MEDKTLIAVYGTLRKGQHNHGFLINAKYLGEFDSNPEYTMYSLSSFPGVVKNGNTSIKLEVYEVSDPKTKKRIDNLEGYMGDNHSDNLYNKDKIMTPYGEAYIYLYNDYTANKIVVESGDWVDYKRTLTNNINRLQYGETC